MSSKEPLILTYSTLSIAELFLCDDFRRTCMPGMARLRVIENRDPHVQVFARHEVLIVLAARDEIAASDQCPVADGPMRRAFHMVAIAFVFAGNQDSRDNRTDRDFGVIFLGVGYGLFRIHPPDRSVIDGAAWLGIPGAHLLVHRLIVLGQAKDFDGLSLCVFGRRIEFEVVGVRRIAGVAPIAGLVTVYFGDFARCRWARGADVHVIDFAEEAAARGFPLPHVDHVAVGVVIAAPVARTLIFGERLWSEMRDSAVAEIVYR